MKHYSTQELMIASGKVPAVVQEALSSDTTVNVLLNLGMSFKLHIDQLGTLAELNVQMLLGLINAQEFLQELIALKISDAQAQQILSEINTKIFMPLREQMRNAGTVVAQPARSAPPPPRAAVVNAQVPNYAPEERSIAPAPVSTPPVKTPVPAPSQNRQTQQSATASLPPRFGAARPALTALPRPEAVSLRLEDHEMARLEFQTAPVAAPATTPVARTAPPPENLPGATPPAPPPAPTAPVPPRVDPPVIPPPPVIQRPTAPTPAPVAPARPPYSADPYREPLES